jgi:hypothetical protein
MPAASLREGRMAPITEPAWTCSPTKWPETDRSESGVVEEERPEKEEREARGIGRNW